LFAFSLGIHGQKFQTRDFEQERVGRITMNTSGSSVHSKECLAAVLIALICVGCSRDPHAAMLKYAKSGDAYAAAGRTAEAIIEYRNALEKDPRAGDVRAKLAEAYLSQGEGGRAIEEYVRAADVLSDAPSQLKAGKLLLLARRFDDARVRAEKALAAEPKNVDAQILLANALAGLKDLDRAVVELEEAIQLQPKRSATYANLGGLEFERGHLDSAEQAFKRAVELSPSSAPAHLALGSFFWATMQLPAAEHEISEALRVERDSVLAHRMMATFYLVTNRRDEAEPHLRRVLEITKSSSAAIALADYYVIQNKGAEARAVLESIAKDPKVATAAASTRLAALDRAAGRSDEAYRRLDDVLATDAGQLQALVLKSGFLLGDRKMDDAVKTATAAVEAHRDAPAAFAALGRAQAANRNRDAAITAYQEAVRLNPLATDSKIALARLQLASGRAESSMALAAEALKAQPQNADARLVLVQGLISKGELQRAETELDVLKAGFPDSAAVHVQMGILLGRMKKPAEARREFERALELHPDLLDSTAGLVALDLSLRRFDDARTRADALIKDPGAKTEALMLGARTYAALRDFKTSEQLFRRVLTGDPSYLGAYAALAQIYAKQGRLDAALVELDALMQRDPKAVAALTLSGMILAAQGKTDAAQDRFERAMQVDPEAPVAANNLAWIYAANGGNLDVALQLAQTSKRKLTDSPEVNDTLGYIYYKKNLPTLAIPSLRASTEKDPTNAIYHYHLGLAYAKAGESARARQALTQALTLDSDFKGAQDAQSVLQSIGRGQ
jgi:tetratricopeptide (TPR) repeat protein